MRSERRVFRRRRLSMTSLIDVIFLLLLFFMLSSTFARHGELPLSAAAAGPAPADGPPPVFLRLAPDGLTLNGTPVEPDALPAALSARAEGGLRVLVAVSGPVTAQPLVDTLSALRKVPEAAVTVID